MYDRSAAFYDAIYRAAGLDYAADAGRVHGIIQAHKRSAGSRLLDVACGTGRHDEYLKRHYTVEGVDLSPDMLTIAQERNPDLTFHVGDMTRLQLGRQYDAVICMFSSIGYARTLENLHLTLRGFAEHTVPGGVVVVGGWLRPDQWIPGFLKADVVDEPDMRVARLSRSERHDTISVLEMHYLVLTRDGVDSFVERHEMGLFTPEQYCAAFEAAGLTVTYAPEGGYARRGQYVGVRPAG